MLKNRLFSMLAIGALVGFAACGGEAEEGADVVTTDTLTTPGTEMVEVPTTDTSVVTTEISVDTAIDADTTQVSQ